ncbi:hypothetical protein HA466_0287720 [Hirschfeldia incana]|nr:hypothetical protein HA466_0287720 [Hirschfeldia incana]
MLDLTKLSEIRIFIDECKSDPSLLSTPSLAFFREYLESLGANLPNAAYGEEDKDTKAGFVEEKSADGVEGTEEPNPKLEEDEEQCLVVGLENVDLQGETVEPDCEPIHKERDLSDENREAAQDLKGKAMDCVSEGKFYKAVQHLTRAIAMNPTSAILYGNRACVYIKLMNPKAAFRDAVNALEINPDSAKGYKARGMARAMLGEWAEAAKDLHLASMIDYDEEISDVLKEIDPHINKMEEQEHWRQRRHAESQAGYDKAKKQEQSSSSTQDAKKQERSSSARQNAKKQGHSSSNKHRQEPRRQEQSSSSRQSTGGFHDSFPGIFPGGFLGGFPGSFPPGDYLHDQSGFLRGSPFGSPFDSPFGYQN